MQFKKILIIDDDTKNIFALKAFLKSKNYEVLSASTAEEGFAKLNEDPEIKIVLMDMMMPDIDGYEAIKQLRGTDKFNKLPIISVTAQALKGDKEKCLEAGATDYVSKPIDIDRLLSMIEKYSSDKLQ